MEFFSKRETIPNRNAKLERYAEMGKISHELFHDILNPLSGIILYLEMLKNNKEISNATKELSESGDKIKNFINLIQNNLLNPEQDEIIDINCEINQIIKLLYHKAKINNVSIIFISNSKNEIIFSKIKFYQLIINLLSNAIDSYQGISGKNKIIIKAEEIKNRQLELKVTDNGCGIKKENLNKIFKDNYSSKDTGFGIGLKTVLNIIKEHKGKINIESDINQGTTFKVSLPKNNF